MAEQHTSEPRWVGEDGVHRFELTCRMTDERLDRMTSAERDRLLQRHLSAAMSPSRKLDMICEMTDLVMALRGSAAVTVRDSRPSAEGPQAGDTHRENRLPQSKGAADGQ